MKVKLIPIRRPHAAVEHPGDPVLVAAENPVNRRHYEDFRPGLPDFPGPPATPAGNGGMLNAPGMSAGLASGIVFRDQFGHFVSSFPLITDPGSGHHHVFFPDLSFEIQSLVGHINDLGIFPHVPGPDGFPVGIVVGIDISMGLVKFHKFTHIFKYLEFKVVAGGQLRQIRELGGQCAFDSANRISAGRNQ